MPDLIKLLQGKSVGLERAIRNLRVNWGRKVLADRGNNGETTGSGCYSDSDYEQASGISKRQLEKKIHEIAKKVDRVWQVDKSILEKYNIPSPPSNKFDLHSKITAVSPRHHNCPPIQKYVLKENLSLNKTQVDITDKQDRSFSKQDGCHSPAIKRLKLTETSSSVIIT